MNANENGYEGWSNYETWAASLNLSNDAGSYEYWREMTRDIASECDTTCRRGYVYSDAAITLANVLEGHHQEMMPELDGVYADLLAASIQAINWREIASTMLADLD